MFNNDSSYIKMESKKVIYQCDLIMSEITKKRELDNRLEIAGIIKNRRKWIKRFSFLKRFLSIDKDIIKKQKEIHHSFWGYVAFTTAKECMSMAKHAPDRCIFLSRDDFCYIFPDDVKQ